MRERVNFLMDGKLQEIDFSAGSGISPTTTVLQYLRSLPHHKGVKEGCAEGDCGACTVVLGEMDDAGGMRYHSIDSCLVFLPMLHGRQLITVEHLAQGRELHPVQQAMVETGGSQCGYCTPGFIMSLFSLYKNTVTPTRTEIDDALTGNLCRCTGYRPIVEAAARSCVHNGVDQFSRTESDARTILQSISRESLYLRCGDQQYFKPASLHEALALITQYPDILVLSGATDIALRVTKRNEILPRILDISDISEMKKISFTDDRISVGAGVSLNRIMPAVKNDFPALFDMLSVFGSQQIRNLATLGGNLGTASPIGDTLPVLLAYQASVVLQSVRGLREIPLNQFIIGYRKTLRMPDELITQILLPKNSAVVRSYKISKRKDLDISTVSAGFRLERESDNRVRSIVLAYGGMAERTKQAAATEEYLRGKKWERTVVEEAMQCIPRDFTPMSDARAGARMRMIAAQNLLLKFWSDTVDA